MDKIHVVWKSYHEPDIIPRGYWDQGMLEDIFKRDPEKWVHHTSFSHFNDYRDPMGAVVIINGRTHTEDAEKINEDIAKLKWVLFIDTGDEEAVFPWREIKHPVMRVWVMLPRMNQHDDVSFHIPNGYRPTTREMIKQAGYQEHKSDWFFAGQINHDRREQCAHELRLMLEGGNPNGNLITTERFGEEKLNYQDYMKTMSDSKVVMCPSGIESPDNFRLYEALEAGCVPVVDAFATNNQSYGFWRYLFKEDPPFPVVDYWDKLPALLPELLNDYPANANRIFAWWQQKKREMRYKLEDDIKELSK